MSRFGDFTLLEDLGKSAVADRFKAMHATQGGPFFLKLYRRLDPRFHAELRERGDLLIGKSHPGLAPHLGHGVVGDVPFVVSRWLDGIDLVELSASMKDRRVNLTLDQCLLILGDLALAVGALHQWAPQAGGSRLAHGDVSIGHVRVGPDGQVWLTGLTTPRGLEPGKVPEARFDLAGVGALIYDLVPLLRGGAARPPLPTPLDRVIRRALGIGPASEHLSAPEFADRLAEVADSLKLKPDRAGLAEAVKRTMRAVEKKILEQGGRPVPGAPPRSPADAIPELVPVSRGAGIPAVLEPLLPAPRPTTAATPMVPLQELTPLGRALPPAPATPPAAPRPAPAAVPSPLPTFEPAPEFLTGAAQRLAQQPPRPAATTPAPAPSPVAPVPFSPVPPPVAPVPFSPVPPARPAAPPAMTASPAPAVGPAPPRPAAPALPPDVSLPPGGGPLPPFLAHSPAGPPPTVAPRPPPSPSPAGAPPSGQVLPPPAPPTAPRPATLPMFSLGSVPASVPPDLRAGLEVAAQKPKPKTTLLSDADESGAVQRPPLPPPPPLMEPAPHPDRDRTDPDAVRPARIEAQKALPAVQALLRAGVVTAADVEAAAVAQTQRGGRTLEILVASGATTDDTIAATLAAAAGRPRAGAELRAPIDPSLLRRIPQTYALARRLLPLALHDSVLVLAVADPFDQKVIDEVQSLLHAASVDVRVAPRAELTHATMAAFGAASGDQAGGPRILLCVHDDAKADKLGARLAHEGMQVEHVVDGNVAKQILSSRRPDAIITAHDLPGLDGRALLLFVRSSEKLGETPFFVLGPRGDDDLIARMLDLGADDYFGEPLRPDVIVAKLRRAVGKRVDASAPPAPVAPPPASPLPTRPPPLPKAPTTSSAPPVIGGEFEFDDLPDLPPEYETSSQQDVPAMPTGVMGTLRQMALPEIVQSLEMGRKTASVDIVPQDGEKGVIAFDSGAVRYAECGALRGEQAFFALMRHKEGFFRIHYGDQPPSVNIESPTTFLLLEAMRLMDEEGSV